MSRSPEQYERWKKLTNKRRQRRLYWLRKYKAAKGCEICGYDENGLALDFDHIKRDEKKFYVSSRFIMRSLKALFLELRKCRVLCANCHRIYSYEEKHFNNKRTTKTT